MSKKLFVTACLVGASFLATAANAAEQPRWPNWYVGLNGGIGWYPDSDISSPGLGSGELTTNSGWYGSVAIGYLPRTTMGFFNMSRFELEYGFRTNPNDTLGGLTGLDGDTTVHSVMANMYLDFVNDTIFTPYVGGGIGLGSLETDNAGIELGDDVFAWQLMAGLSYEPESLPMTSWNVGYRYFALEDAEYTFNNVTFEQEYSNHALEAGAKFRF